MTDDFARVGSVMIDCHDPEALFAFWSQLLDVQVAQRYPDFIFASPLPGNHISLAFQRVPEDKTVKNRLHLDLIHEDPDAFITKVESLGGSRLADQEVSGFRWTILADPEGNEFCVTPPSEH
jgi:predicted enzyme related to lactoylglutathione lyase